MNWINTIFKLKEPNKDEMSNIRRNEASIIELHFELFKQFAWLGSATIGAIVLLIQLDVLSLNSALSKAIAAFAVSIILSIFGQVSLVSSLAAGKSINQLRSAMGLYTMLTLFVFGIGVGMALPT